MAELTIDLTYGNALFEAARETGQKQRITEEAAEVLDVLHQEPDLHAFLNYPAISADEKKAVVKNVFGDKICEELINFIYVLIDKRRTMHLEKIIKVYNKLTDKEEGLSYGTVYSVIPLGEERMEKIEEETSKLLGLNVKLVNEIDPKLIGGIRIFADGKVIDASVKKKFADLSSQIKFDQGGKK